MHRIALAALVALAVPAGAGTLRQAALAEALFARGQATADPVLVLAAARLRKATGLDPQPMLDAAAGLADDPALAALAADIAAETAKGVASGPVYRIAPLAPGATAEVPALPFRGGEYAEAYAEAAPGTDLNLAVLDAAGRVVCADTDASHVAYCGWTPAADGAFTLRIENRGTEPAEYALMTN